MHTTLFVNPEPTFLKKIYTMWNTSMKKKMLERTVCSSQMNHILNSMWPETNAWRMLLDKKIQLSLFSEQTWKSGMKIIIDLNV